MKKTFSTLVAATALLCAVPAQAIPFTITTGAAALDNLGGDIGVAFDKLSVPQTSIGLNLSYGQSTTTALQNFTLSVGDTGWGSGGRVETFNLNRNLSVNGGTSQTLVQGGKITIGYSADMLDLFQSGLYTFSTQDGADRYQVGIRTEAFNISAGGGDFVRPVNATITLTNIADAPVARLSGVNSVSYGAQLTFSGNLSSDADLDGSIVSYAWDLDNNGVFERASTTSDLMLALNEYDDLFANKSANHRIGLRVTDNTGLSSIASLDFAMNAVQAEVPEPATAGLMLLGLAGLLAQRRRAAGKSA